MALKKPLVMYNGIPGQIQASDTLDATLSEVDQISMSNGESVSVTLGMPAYVSAANTVKKAIASAIGTTDILGVIRDTSIAAGASGYVQTDGQLVGTTAQWDAVAGTTGGLAAGTVYYLSATTAGMLTATAPTTTGQYVVRIGKAVSPTILDLNISSPIGL